jgi:DNA-directed RNA polymerase subunit beta'
MVLGCYYLTAENPAATKGVGGYYSSLEDAITAYDQQQVDLHSYVWVRFDGVVDPKPTEADLLEEQTSEDGVVTKLYKSVRVRHDRDGNMISQYVRTTPGRIIYNKTIHDALAG